MRMGEREREREKEEGKEKKGEEKNEKWILSLRLSVCFQCMIDQFNTKGQSWALTSFAQSKVAIQALSGLEDKWL